MAVSSNKDTLKYPKFLGLRTTDDATEIGFTGFTKAENVDISRKLKVSRRKGGVQVYSGSVDSAYIEENTMLFTDGVNLREMNKDFTATLIRSDLTAGGNLVGYRFGETVFYSNGYETGVYSAREGNRTLGLTRPSPVFLSETEGGDLSEGQYMAAAVFVAEDGQESGASQTSRITVSENAGITFLVPVSADSTVKSVALYLSTKDGTELYFAGTVNNGTATFNFNGSADTLYEPIRTMDMQPPPAFSDVEYFASRMLYAVGDLLVYSIPFGYGLVDMRYNFVPCTAKITMIAPVTNGVYIGTETQTLFLSGRQIEDANLTVIADYGVVPGTKKYVSAGVIGGIESEDIVPVWVSHKGICVGLSDGGVKNLTQKTVDLPKGVEGAAMFRHNDGQNHYVSIIRS